jgi:hypothetical protein
MDIQKAIQTTDIPDLYSTENIATEDKMIHCHFVFGHCHWFAAEYDKNDTCFGYVILNGDFQNAEWGYFSLQELQEVSLGSFHVQIDTNWKVQPAKNIELIKLSGGIF